MFRRNLKKKKTVSGQSAREQPKWRYEDQMSFLLDHILERNQRSNIENQLSDNEDTINADDSQFSNTNAGSPAESVSLQHSPSPLPFSSSNNSSLNSSTSGTTSLKRSNMQSTSQILEKYLSRKKEEKTEKDPLSKYFEAVEATVRNFKRAHQIEVKTKINNLISEYEMKALLEQETPQNTMMSPPNPLSPIAVDIPSSPLNYSSNQSLSFVVLDESTNYDDSLMYQQ